MKGTRRRWARRRQDICLWRGILFAAALINAKGPRPPKHSSEVDRCRVVDYKAVRLAKQLKLQRAGKAVEYQHAVAVRV